MLDPCPVSILNNAKSRTKLLLKMCSRGNSTFQRHKCLPGTGPLSSFLCLLFICISRENSKERQKVSLLKTGSRGTVSHSLPGVNEISCLYVGENDPELLILLPPFLKFWTNISLTSNLPVEYLIVKKPKVIGYKNKTNYQKYYIYPKA